MRNISKGQVMDDTVMLTYSEAARLLKCQEKSVSIRAKRNKWRKERGNDGYWRVWVPAHLLPEYNPDSIPDQTDTLSPSPSVEVTRLEGEIKALEVELKAAIEARDRLQLDLTQEREARRADKAEALQREAGLTARITAQEARADSAADRADQLADELSKSKDAARDLAALLEQERSKTWWQKLRGK